MASDPIAPDPLAPDALAPDAVAGPVAAGDVPVSPTVARVQRRTLLVLVGAQILVGLGVAIGIAVGSLLAADLAGTASLAGLAATAAVAGTALLAAPVSRVMDRHGRRRGLVLAYVVAATGAGVVVLAGIVESFPLALLGLVLFGGGSAGNLQARFVAVDLATVRNRGTALSIVVWAATVSGVVGPNLADPAGQFAGRLGLDHLSGPFLLSLVSFAGAAVVIWALLRPDPLLLARAERGDDLTVVRPRTSVRAALRIVAAHQSAMLGLGAIAVGHAAMVGVMTMTPVHMEHGGATLRVIGLVISVHIAGMFAFSPLVGMAADRIGRRPVIVAGTVLLLVACAVSGTAAEHDSTQLGIGLTLLGLGWSCTLVAGSTLLTESIPVDARPSVQGASDVVMNVAGAAASIVAGVVVAGIGFGWLALFTAIAVLPLAAAALRPARTG